MHIKVIKTKILQDKAPLLAFMDVAFDEIIVYGCKVMDGRNGIWASLPQIKSTKDNKWYPVVKIDSEVTKSDFQAVAIEAYNENTLDNGGEPKRETGAGRDLLDQEMPF